LLTHPTPTNQTPKATKGINHFWMVDLLKVLAAQAILWHHFCRYGPLARTLESAGHEWVAFIGNHGRHAVQVFLVISGFLAARSVRSFIASSSIAELANSMQRSWISRLLRLGKPYWLMLLVAIMFAALTRWLQPDVDTPSTPNWWQVATHFLFLQDIFAKEALSTGVWYVAIDLQLSLLFLVLLLVSSATTANAGKLNPDNADNAERVLEAIVWLLMLVALFGFNRWRSLDIWAIYFFGSFGLGAAVAFRLSKNKQNAGIFWIALVSIFGLANAIEWRTGLLVALVCAALLWWANAQQVVSLGERQPSHQWLKKFSGDSYALFLFHYPVVMLIGAIIDISWPQQVTPAMLGLIASWAISMLVAFGVTRALSRRSSYKNRSKILRPARSNFR
jgi:peptidoglycan/LPS O-acetylase OafA/YrhL